MGKSKIVNRLIILSFSSALIYVGKLALLLLPNIEVVTFLLIIYTLSYNLRDALLISTVYTIIEVLHWGFSEQMYIWTVIVLLTYVFKKVFKENFLWWAVFSGFLGWCCSHS